MEKLPLVYKYSFQFISVHRFCFFDISFFFSSGLLPLSATELPFGLLPSDLVYIAGSRVFCDKAFQHVMSSQNPSFWTLALSSRKFQSRWYIFTAHSHMSAPTQAQKPFSDPLMTDRDVSVRKALTPIHSNKLVE